MPINSSALCFDFSVVGVQLATATKFCSGIFLKPTGSNGASVSCATLRQAQKRCRRF